VAALPAMALRRAPVRLMGSGTGGPAAVAPAAEAFADVARRVAAGEIVLDVQPVPLAEVEKTWSAPAEGRRVVFRP
jgi:hypothetical protein